MARFPALLLVRLAFAVAAVSVASGEALAQGAIVSGMVTDSVGAPVFGAQVGITGVSYRAVTDADGVFHLSGVPAGAVQLSVRRLGFSPVMRPLLLAADQTSLDSVVVKLLHIPAALPMVTVKTKKVKYTGRLAGYYQRLEAKNSGYFITREQIDRENPRSLQDLMAHAPGISNIRARNGNQTIRMRGRACAPFVWLDGTPFPASEVDLSAISPQTLHGIELYLGSTTAPMRFMGNRQINSCGTIVLWSRGPDTDPITNTHRPNVDLSKLVASLTIYTVEQVDSKAEPVTDSMVVAYPPSLFAAGVGGGVIAEYVVDPNGKMEDGTFGVVSSTNPLFSEAVREAVAATRFRPAQLKGQNVRQLVQQPFTFVAPRAR